MAFLKSPYVCESHKLAWKIGERDHPIFKALTKLNEGNRTCEPDILDACELKHLCNFKL